MQIKLARQIHGKYGSLRGTVDVKDEAYAEQLIKRGLAKRIVPKKKAKKAD